MDILPSAAYLPDSALQRTRRTAEALAAPQAPGPVRRSTHPAIDRTSKLYKASVEFEAILIKQMLNAMKKSVPKSGLIDGGMAEEFFEDMLYDEYAKKMAETARFGLADMIVRQLSTSNDPAGTPGD